MPEGLSVAVVGATGAVGVELLQVLMARRFPVGTLRALASERSAGGSVRFGDRQVPVEALDDANFDGVDVALFSAGGARSLQHAPRAAEDGAVVIDNSSAYRGDPNVPLVVPEVNGRTAHDHRGIVANPNCSTILLALVLAPIERRRRIRRVVCSTYQAVSGSGAAALRELDAQARAAVSGQALPCTSYPKPIHGNVLPFVQGFGDDGITLEEWKMVHETRRILERPDLAVSATCVRVPVRRAHSEAVNLEFDEAVHPEEIRAWLQDADGVEVLDSAEAPGFPTPCEAEGRDEVLVGRIRKDPGRATAVDLWLTGDQLLKGAALNAVQIAEVLFGVGKAGSVG